jgi:hypothetical protein
MSTDRLAEARRLRDEKLARSRASGLGSSVSPTRRLGTTRTLSSTKESTSTTSTLPTRSRLSLSSTNRVGSSSTTTSRTSLSASDAKKAVTKSPLGAVLTVGGHVSIRGKTAMLQVDNDDGTWDIEWDDTGADETVRVTQMRSVTRFQQDAIDRKKRQTGNASVRSSSSPNFSKGSIDDVTDPNWLSKFSSKASSAQMKAYMDYRKGSSSSSSSSAAPANETPSERRSREVRERREEAERKRKEEDEERDRRRREEDEERDRRRREEEQRRGGNPSSRETESERYFFPSYFSLCCLSTR